MDFLIAKDDLHRCRVERGPMLEPGPGQALLSVQAFGLTSNNVTYAKFGEAMSYWSFFPAQQDGWGRMPVWGFAEVAVSRHEHLPEGTRVFGYLPPSDELLVTPVRVEERGFADGAPHRSKLPPTYNVYTSVASDPLRDDDREAEQMLLRPLFFTSWLIDDFLAENDFFGVSTVVLSSASSKTAGALAHELARRAGIEVVGLTSARGTELAERLGVYDEVIPYEQLDELPAGRAVYVDMAGDAAVRAAVHGHFGDRLAHSAVVGATHHDRLGDVPDSLPGPRPTFFFAPDRVSRRSAEWGRQELEHRLAEAWRPYVEWTEGWLRIERDSGPEAVRRCYLDLLDGRSDPASGHVLDLRG